MDTNLDMTYTMAGSITAKIDEFARSQDAQIEQTIVETCDEHLMKQNITYSINAKKLVDLVMRDTATAVKRGRYFYGNNYYCPKCDDYLSAQDNFCRKCGQRLDWTFGSIKDKE